MKRIQTTKAAQSILTFEKEIVDHSYQYGQINDTFHKEVMSIVEQCVTNLEKDSDFKEEMSEIDILKEN
jgi:hypothetical protein